MKKKLMIYILAGCMLTSTGCGKANNLDNSTQQNNNPKEEVSISKDTNNLTEGIYPNSKGIIKIPMGISVNGTPTTGCTLKMPIDYITTGYGFNKDENDESYLFNGNTLEFYSEQRDLEGINVSFVYMIKGGNDYSFKIVSKEEYNLESIKEDEPNGFEVGDASLPSWAYMLSTEYYRSFVVFVSLNNDMSITLIYDGPLIEELGEKKLAKRLYNLIELTK